MKQKMLKEPSDSFKKYHSLHMASPSVGDTLYQDVNVTHKVDDINRTYQPCHDCADGDIVWDYWITAGSPCWVGYRYRCQTPVASKDCKMFASVGAKIAKAVRPYVKGKDEKQKDKNIVCTYDMREMTGDAQALREWMKFRYPLDEWDNALMRDYCAANESTPATLCPANPVGPCPNLLTKTICREWANTNKGKPTADELAIDWCNKHPTSPLCGCILRAKDSAYLKVQKMYPFGDECWYLPCKDREQIKGLLTYDMRHPKNCPIEVCQTIIDISNSHDINLKDIEMITDCSINPQTPDPIKDVKYIGAFLGGCSSVMALGVGLVVLSFLVR